MNFLAHAWLASQHPEPDDGLVAGGVAGDWVKGPLDRCALSPGLLRGVALHRAIDAFAETHPAFRRSRRRISENRRRWSGVFVDLFYDHLLARDWAHWHPLPLADYTRRVYSALGAQTSAETALSAEARTALAKMAAEDWLGQYATPDGISDVLARMARRVRRTNPLAEGAAELLADLSGFEADFSAFLPDAVAFTADWRTDLKHADGVRRETPPA